MNALLTALQFLTIFPIRLKPENIKIPASMVYFPVIGLVLGAILAGAGTLCRALYLNPFLSSAIIVILLIVLTGGLHLDGLADTFDALGSFKDKERSLEIMRDPHIGTMGVLSLIAVVLLKTALIFSLPPAVRGGALIMMCVSSRYLMVVSIFLFPYARSSGKAKAFFDGINIKILLAATLLALAFPVWFYGIRGVLALATAGGLIVLVNWVICRKIGGITGDILGAVCELSEVAVLSLVLIIR